MHPFIPTLLLCGLAVLGYSQATTYPLHGCVTDAAGEPLIGATVVLRDAGRRGVLTDAEGCFTLASPDSVAMVVVNYAGYSAQEVTLATGQPAPTLVLTSSASLDEVVVTGRGVTKTESRVAAVRGSRSASTTYYVDGARVAPPPPSPGAVPIAASYEVSASHSAYSGPSQAAGQLTAGVIHDFSKWELWQDISAEDLAEFRRAWQFHAQHRYTLQVTNPGGSPAVDIPVELRNAQGQQLWLTRTDHTGKAECWAGLFDANFADTSHLQLVATYQGKEWVTARAKPFHQGMNFLVLPTPCTETPVLDIAFVVDATGSMQDEISYLQSELLDVIRRAQDSLPGAQLRLGNVFYRDQHEAYLTRTQPLSARLQTGLDFIGQQQADGGGDFPEAVEVALATAIDSLDWRPAATARLLFLVLDAPPHQLDSVITQLQASARRAAALGIHLIPVTCSGIDKSTEYLMRSLALATNGHYTFLTNHSGIGNPHIEPTTDEYQVEKLNDLLVRLVTQYGRLPTCQPQTTPPLATADSLLIPLPALASAPNPAAVWRIFPNPTTGPLTVEAPSPEAVFYLADSHGKILQRFQCQEGRANFELGQYPAGSYLLVCEHQGHTSTGRVILVSR